MKNYLQLPNILTLVRLVVAPLALPALFYWLIPYNNAHFDIFLALLFIFFNLTDLFDGYFARKYKLESKLGEILDPLADKFLFVAVMIVLVALQKLFFYWAIIFITRDFLVMGLRVVSADHGFRIPVSYLAKVKTALVMLYLTAIIVQPVLASYIDWAYYGELALLCTSLGLAIWTAVRYSIYFVNHYTRMAQS